MAIITLVNTLKTTRFDREAYIVTEDSSENRTNRESKTEKDR